MRATPRKIRSSARRADPPVLLVSMPFGPLFWPSLGLGLLQAALERRAIASRVRYFTLDFASTIGQRAYDTIAMTGTLSVIEMAGEWAFSHTLFDRSRRDVRAYVTDVLERRAGSRGDRRPVPRRVVDQVLRARDRAEGFLDRCAREVTAARPRVVGFTSVFQQHVASLALARRLRRDLPDVHIVFGGANVEGVMGAETVRSFPFIDAVVSGEGDAVFPQLVERVLAGGTADGLPGVHTRATVDDAFARTTFANTPVVRDMDALPYPDYRDYFRQFRRSRLSRDWRPSVLVETSRGCWWGERSHCTFCGLNGTTLAYRSKSAPRALEELEWLARRYRGSNVQVVDNILDLDYFRTLLPELAERRLDFSLFYETKSNLKKDQVRLLAAAGVHHIQPGIESFSDPVLKLMRKGVSALHNVQLLKWCKQFGVTPLWNLLWGFPGEPPGEYAKMARLVPRLTHLRAPVGIFALRLDRFSPNYDQADALGFTDVRPLPSYRSIYDLPDRAIDNLAYYFTYGYRDPSAPAGYADGLFRAIERWRRVQARADLFSADVDGRLLIWDLRPSRRRALTVLDDLDRQLVLACDGVTEIGRLTPLAGADADAVGRLASRLEMLVREGLMVQDGTRYLSLVIALGDYSPGTAVVHRFDTVVRQLGRRTSAGVVIPLEGGSTNGASASGQRRRGARPASRGRRSALTPDRFRFDRRGDLVVR